MSSWDWRRLIPSWDYHELSLSKWPGWDKDQNNEPYHIVIILTKGQGKSSREIATEFDNIASSNFWYRDFTDDGMPFVNDGETYKSIFVFQFKEDWEKFKEIASN